MEAGSSEEASDKGASGAAGLAAQPEGAAGGPAFNSTAPKAAAVADGAEAVRGGEMAAITSRLCSVSPFDVGDPRVATCRQLSRGRGALYGGQMCIREPTELAACPRPWQ